MLPATASVRSQSFPPQYHISLESLSTIVGHGELVGICRTFDCAIRSGAANEIIPRRTQVLIAGIRHALRSMDRSLHLIKRPRWALAAPTGADQPGMALTNRACSL